MPRLLDTTRAARREQVLLAAVICFARRGYHETTMDEIAAEAGVAKGGPYVYFAGKEAIFLALYDAWDCTLHEEIEAALAALPDVERTLSRRVLQAWVEVTGRHVQTRTTACRVLMEGRHLATYIPAIAERVTRTQAAEQRAIEALLRTGVAAGEWPASTDVPARATLIRAALHGLMAAWHAAPASFDWDAMASALVDW